MYLPLFATYLSQRQNLPRNIQECQEVGLSCPLLEERLCVLIWTKHGPWPGGSRPRERG